MVLSEVIDPDLAVNIVDLGFRSQIRAGLAPLRGIDGFRVDWQWLPAWRPADMTEAGRDRLRAIGFSCQAANAAISAARSGPLG